MKKEEIAEVVRLAAAEVLAKREEIIEDEFDSRYHDVELLMKNYRKLKAHYANVAPELPRFPRNAGGQCDMLHAPENRAYDEPC